MTIIHIKTEKSVKKSRKEMEREQKENCNHFLLNQYKNVPLKEPTYIVEMSAKEIQLVSFYLELENRKPILNVEVDTEIKKEKDDAKDKY